MSRPFKSVSAWDDWREAARPNFTFLLANGPERFLDVKAPLDKITQGG